MSPLLSLAFMPQIDLVSAFSQGDVIGLGINVFLFIVSVYGIALYLHKSAEIKKVVRATARFEKVAEAESGWDKLYLASRDCDQSPLARLLRETYVECKLENWFQQKELGADFRLNIAKRTIDGILSKTINDEETRLKKRMEQIAGIATIAPLVGLFGTVYGVLIAFQAIGLEGSAGISNLAPGVSTALTTTLLGLLAAIPAYFGHIKLMTSIKELASRMENFAQDLENAVRKQILMDEKT